MKHAPISFAVSLILVGGCAQAPPDVQLASAILQDDPAAISQAAKAGSGVNIAFQYREEKKKHYLDAFHIEKIWRKLPLKVATKADKPQAVQALLKAGADPNGIQEPLDGAPLHGFPSVAVGEKLIAGGADVNLPMQGYFGFSKFWKPTPLMIAIQQGRRDRAELLLKHGAKVQARDGEGSTAWRYIDPHRPDLRRLLLSYGAKPNDSGLPPAKLQAVRERRKKEEERLEAQQDQRDSLRMDKEDEMINSLLRHTRP